MSSSTMRDGDRPPGQSNDLLARHVRALEGSSTLLRLITIATAVVVLVAVLCTVGVILVAALYMAAAP